MEQLTLLTGPADTWLAALVDTSLRLSVILLVAGAIAMVLRRSAANLRHLVWALALGGALMLPLAASYLPTLNLPVPQPLQVFARPAADAAVRGRLSETSSPAETRTGPAAGVMAGNLQEADVLTAVSGGVTPETVTPAVSDVARLPVVVPTPSGPAVPSRSGLAWSWQPLVVGLWITGVVVLLLRIGVGIAATQRIGRRAACPRDGEWVRLAAELGRRIGLSRPVRILSSSHTSVPMTWGWLRPVVLVPDAGAVWSAARKRVVLLHELNHVKRHDCASQLVAHVACAVYWFNPLVWLAARALRVERERACDEAVVADGTQASSYADHLLEIARGHQGARWSLVTAVAMARRSQLEGRLLSILDAGQRRRPSRRTALALGTVMTGVVLILTAVTPTIRAAAPVEAGGLAALTAVTVMTTEVSLEGIATPAPTDRGVPAVVQTPAPASPQTPATADEVEAREQAQRTAVEQAEAEATQRRLEAQQARVQDRARVVREQVRALEQRLEQVREQRDRGAVVAEPEIERALEIARRAADFDLDLCSVLRSW